MSQRSPVPVCTRCGARLRGGVCPNGHPQRAARSRRARRDRPRLLGPLIVVVLLVVGGYLALFWYPKKAATDVVVPSSADFASALETYRGATEAFPAAGPDPTAILEGAGATIQNAGAARTTLADVQTRFEGRTPLSVPVISGRPPLPEVEEVRDRMIAFAIGGLELVSDLEAVSRYLTQVGPVLPKLIDLRQALGEPKNPRQVDAVLPAARPVADQILADVEALTPPPEAGAAHEALRAIAGSIRTNLDELDRLSGRTAPPIIQTLVDEIARQLEEFGTTFGDAPAQARDAGLRSRIQELNGQAREIVTALVTLRDTRGIEGLTIPELPEGLAAPVPGPTPTA